MDHNSEISQSLATQFVNQMTPEVLGEQATRVKFLHVGLALGKITSQLQTDTQHAKRKWRGIKVGKEKCNLIDDGKLRKCPNK